MDVHGTGESRGGGAGRCGDRRFFWGMMAILALAVVLRAWSIDHGLPHSYYADEAHFVKRSVAFGSGDLNPHWFHKPAFFMYVLFVEYGLYFLVGKVGGWWASPMEFAHHFFNDPGMFYLLGRATASAAGVGAVLLTILCGRRLAGRTAGLIAGLIVACNFCLAEAGRWVKADVPCVFFTVLATYGLIRMAESGQRRAYWLTGLSVGVGMATKYYALALVPSCWLVHWLGRRPAGEPRRFVLDRRPWEATIVAFLAFFACSPFNVLDGTWWHWNVWPRIEHILVEKLGVAGLALGFAPPAALLDSARSLLRCLVSPACLGPVGSGLALAGLAYQLVRGPRPAWVPLLAVLPFAVIAVLWNPVDFEPRYLSAVLPILAIAAAHLLHDIWRGLRARWPGLPPALGAAAVAVLVAPGLLRIVAWNHRHARQDTRTIAARWIEAHIPPGTRLINDNDWVKIRKSVDALRLEWAVIKAYRAKGRGGAFLTREKDYQYEYDIAASRKAAAAGKPTYFTYTLHHPWWARDEDPDGDSGRHPWDLDMATPWPRRPLHPLEIRAFGIRYIVTTAKTYDEYRPGGRFARFAHWAAFYRWVHRLPLVYTIPYQPGVRSGPTVRIYAVEP